MERAVNTLTDHGYQAVVARSAAQFARLAVTARDGYQFEIDFGVDWRAHELSDDGMIANHIEGHDGGVFSSAAPRLRTG